MTRRVSRSGLTLLLSVAAFGAWSAEAGAVDYCVNVVDPAVMPLCDDSSQVNLAGAMNLAQNNGVDDKIYLGPGNYSNSHAYNHTDALEIIGAGVGAVTIDSSSTSISLTGNAASISGVTIQANGTGRGFSWKTHPQPASG